MSIETAWYKTYPHHTFNSYSFYLKTLYKGSAYRISVDAGFACPHRSRNKNHTGCAYCGEQGSRAPYLGTEEDLQAQIKGGIKFLSKRYGARIYLLYFQAFSNTYGPLEKLKSLYDSALSCAPFKELIISTRPDCIDEEKVDLISSYKKKGLTVWVELGLQSAHDKTLHRINRGHTVQDFVDAYRILKNRGIRVAVHLMFGLPGEGQREIEQTSTFVSHLKPDGIKIHNLHIVKNTPLYNDYVNGNIIPPTSREHLEYVISALEYFPRETVIMRLTCDTPGDELVSPQGFWSKSRFYEEVRKEMRKRNTWQGKKISGS